MENLKPFVEVDPIQLQESVQGKFKEIIDLLKLKDVVSKVHLEDTPKRVAKMFVEELFESCYKAPPSVTTFEDSNTTPVISSNISIKSVCAHHFVPFYGKCSIYYIPTLLTGLSKFSRISDYFSRRPQIQENLTRQIGEYLFNLLQPKEIIVGIKAKHMCICHRGVNEDNPLTETFWSCTKSGEAISFEKIRYVMDTIKYTG